MRNKKAPLFGLILLTLLFFIGMIHLFSLRFESGDIYPAYSSLRTDPLGTKVFYEGLRALPDISVDRHFETVSRIVRRCFIVVSNLRNAATSGINHVNLNRKLFLEPAPQYLLLCSNQV